MNIELHTVMNNVITATRADDNLFEDYYWVDPGEELLGRTTRPETDLYWLTILNRKKLWQQ